MVKENVFYSVKYLFIIITIIIAAIKTKMTTRIY